MMKKLIPVLLITLSALFIVPFTACTAGNTEDSTSSSVLSDAISSVANDSTQSGSSAVSNTTANTNFIGDWSRTNVMAVSSASITITNQTSDSFSFHFMGFSGPNIGDLHFVYKNV